MSKSAVIGLKSVKQSDECTLKIQHSSSWQTVEIKLLIQRRLNMSHTFVQYQMLSDKYIKWQN